MKNIFVAALLLLTTFAIAQKPADTVKAPDTANHNSAQSKMPDLQKGVYVTDFTNTLTSDQLKNLNDRATVIYQKTGFELIIVLMEALPKGMDVNAATTAVDEKWSPGESSDADRLVYIAGLRQHGHRIKAVSGSKSIVLFGSAKCTAIMSAMKPDYDKHEYNAGLQLMVDSVSSVLKINSMPSTLGSATNIYIGAFVLAVILVLFIYLKNRKKSMAV